MTNFKEVENNIIAFGTITKEQYNRYSTWLSNAFESVKPENQYVIRELLETIELMNISEEKTNLQIAIELVQTKISNYEICKIKIQDEYLARNNQLGEYFERYNNTKSPKSATIVLATDSSIDTIIHEIGHNIHDSINHLQSLRIPRTTKYSNTNCMESFAEAFTCYIMNPNKYPKATKRIEKVLLENF